MLHLAIVAGARPNFMKIAPMLRVFEQREGIRTTLIHTGQHYDANLSDVFFSELGIRKPDVFLAVGGGTHATQTARILESIEPVFIDGPGDGAAFDGVIVVGDVNSTMAATLAARKLGIAVAHVEAGLRSFDRRMPEEINRLVTDSIANLLLVSEPDGIGNLKAEGQSEEKTSLVGNLMIDTLFYHLPFAKDREILNSLELKADEYAAITLHRPSNVDQKETLSRLVGVLVDVSDQLPVVFPVHPRTLGKLKEFDLLERLQAAHGVHVLEPLGYLDFLSITSQAKVVITDSGGLQEETTALGVPCLTLRENTERPVTVDEGTSTLIGSDTEKLGLYLQQVMNGSYKQGKSPALWDGRAAERIADFIESKWA